MKRTTPLEERAYQFEIRAEQDEAKGGAKITGRPIVFESKTDIGGFFEEVIDQRALDATDLTDVRFLVNHDFSRIPLARSRRNNGNSTMLLSRDESGLFIEVTLDTENNADARALYSAVSRGDISGMSFAFSVRGEEWSGLETDYPTRRITDIESIVEVSAVTFPAYTSTSINARSKEALESAREALEKAKEQRKGDLPEGSNEKEALELLKAKINIL